MKKLVSLVMMLVLGLAITSFESHAQGMSKYDIKQAKKAAKDLVKEGWKPDGTGTIEQQMLRVMNREGNGEILLTGTSLGDFATFNQALANARENAAREYAEGYGSGVVESRLAADVSTTGSSSDKLVAMGAQKFFKKLEAELRVPALKL
ncbi:MAG: hypothetical protein K2H18_04225, partial [Muribaculaceae bacterium]|nr:hypothetical protein [Muribaculaceae bacterium]